MKVTRNVIGIMMLAIVAAGCSTTHQQGASAVAKEEYTPPTSIYNILDSTALVYSDPAAGSAVNDHPFAGSGLLHTRSAMLSTMGSIVRCIQLASGFPYLSGYTAEDNMVDAQRR